MQVVVSEKGIKQLKLFREEAEGVRKGVDAGIRQHGLSLLLDFSAAGLRVKRFAHQLGNALLHSAGKYIQAQQCIPKQQKRPKNGMVNVWTGLQAKVDKFNRERLSGGIVLQYSISMEEKMPEMRKNLSECACSGHQQPSLHPQATSLSNIASLPDLHHHKAHSFSEMFSLLKSNYSSIRQIAAWEAVPQESIYGGVYAFIRDIMNNPSLHFEILSAFEKIDKQIKMATRRSVRLLTTKRPLKTIRTSLNELQLACGQEGNRAGKKVRFSDDHQESISIKLINSHRNDKSRKKMTSFKQNISMARLITLRDKLVLQEIESADNLDEGPAIPCQMSKAVSLEGEEEQLRKSFKKISIIMFDEEKQRQSDIFSEQSYKSLRDLQLPNLKLTEKLIEEIFDSPSPFLITLSLSLLFKFFMKSKFSPAVGQIGWLLGVSTMVAYKVFFDQTIEGLVEYYCKVLTMKAEDLLFLERWFLSGLNYEVVVSNKHYLEMMLRLIKHHPKTN